jgi:transmembrane sensor
LDGDDPLSANEKRALHEWLNVHPSHRVELTRLANYWRRANVLTELAVPLGRAAGERTAPKPGRYRLALAGALAAVLVVAVFIGLVSRRSDGVANGTYGTAIGQQQTIDLSDGSSVQLNTDSQVQVSFSTTERKIWLLRGEALFTVKHEATRPFDVYAADALVRAVGTAFALRISDSSVAVTVTNGVVEINEAAPSTQLDQGSSLHTQLRRLGTVKAGQTATVGQATRDIHAQQLLEPELQRQLAWHEGYLVFSGDSLSDVVLQVNRYSPVRLEIADPSIRSLTVGGRFRIGDLDAVLDVLRTNFGIRAERVDERNIRLESNKPR